MSRTPFTGTALRRVWVVHLVLAFLVLGCRGAVDDDSEGAREPEARNAILITVDTLRPDRMSLYGYERDTTPNLQRFFGERSFTNARSSSPCTMPTVKQLLTGRLDADGPTLAELLRDDGFHTAAVVSQHWFLTDGLYRAGFDSWDAQSETDRDHHGLSSRRATEVTDRALQRLETLPPDRRFFLWVHYFDPHDPYDPPLEGRLFARDVERFPNGDRRTKQFARMTDEQKWFLVDRIFDEKDRDALSRLYDDEVSYVDRELGRLLEGLADRDLLANSAVFFSADHGERLGEEDGAWDHCYSLHDLELRIPLAMRWGGSPDTVDAGTPVGILDLYPTITSVLGVSAPGTLDGRSLLAADPAGMTVAAFDGVAAVTDASWKLYLDCADGVCRPTRLRRLIEGGEGSGPDVPFSEAPEVVRRMTDFGQQRQPSLDRALELAESELRRLRALGYTQ